MPYQPHSTCRDNLSFKPSSHGRTSIIVWFDGLLSCMRYRQRTLDGNRGAKAQLSEARQCPPKPPPTPLPYQATSCLAAHTDHLPGSASSCTCAGTQSPGTHVPGSGRRTGASPPPSTWLGRAWCCHSTGYVGGCCRCSGPCVPCRYRWTGRGDRNIRGIWPS